MADKYEILKKVFGYESFRPAQENIIDNILGGKDVLAVMPTGAGKSLCFQIPALMLSGITIVISPLISLMSDQVSALVQAGVGAAYLNSSLTSAQQSKVIFNIRRGLYKIIYVAPERLETEGFLNAAADMDISMVAVDEAHCISQWGQDFRPSYMNIVGFTNALPKRPIISAFTATATERVKKDISDILALRDPYSVTTGFDRPNLYFGVIRDGVRDDTILKMVKEYKDKSGIIYCSTRKNVEKVTILLESNGLSVRPYHAGLPDETRRVNQEDFIYDRVKVIVATNAFGMGIDKSNVSFVIHYNMPKDMESYYQEAGRAGRDGENADCIILYNGSDYMTNKFLIEQDSGNNPDESAVTRRLRIKHEMKRLGEIMDYCGGTSCLRGYILKYFGEKADGYCGNCSYCLDSSEKRDVTVESQKILSCIVRMGRPYGQTMLTEVLRGAGSQKVKSLGFDRLSTYGIMKDCSADKIRYIVSCLVNLGYIAREGEEFPVLKITRRAALVLKGEEKIEINMPPERKPKTVLGRKKPAEEYAVNPELMDRLKKIRSSIAAKENIPAYIVFTDATLRNMCTRLPQSMDEMLDVSGVGAKKLEKYGGYFLSEITEFTKNNGKGEKHTVTETASPVSAAAEKAENIESAEEDMTITAFCDYIIAEAGITSKNKPLRDAVLNWLTRNGYLDTSLDENGHIQRKTTARSAEAGIKYVIKTGAGGQTYSSILYTPKAQKFILKHLSEISLEEARELKIDN